MVGVSAVYSCQTKNVWYHFMRKTYRCEDKQKRQNTQGQTTAVAHRSDKENSDANTTTTNDNDNTKGDSNHNGRLSHLASRSAGRRRTTADRTAGSPAILAARSLERSRSARPSPRACHEGKEQTPRETRPKYSPRYTVAQGYRARICRKACWAEQIKIFQWRDTRDGPNQSSPNSYCSPTTAAGRAVFHTVRYWLLVCAPTVTPKVRKRHGRILPITHNHRVYVSDGLEMPLRLLPLLCLSFPCFLFSFLPAPPPPPSLLLLVTHLKAS